MTEAAGQGLLSINHRSTGFVELFRRTVSLLRERLSIPPQYSVFFASSATECWELVGQSFIDLYSLHLHNGAFGKKWMEYRQKLSPNASGHAFHLQHIPSLNHLLHFQDADLLCLTQNETSNGSQLRNRLMRKLRRHFSGGQKLIVADATSSMGGVELDWLCADVWFASVQKCFGLPAGMAVMVCSEKALEVAKTRGYNRHYNSLLFMDEMAQKGQTTHTPNVLGLYLLCRTLEQRQPVSQTAPALRKRAGLIYQRLEKARFHLLVQNRMVRSETVVAVKGTPAYVQAIKQEALRNGFLLGNGYGAWKDTTFRIANFPAHTDQEVEALLQFLEQHSPARWPVAAQ